MLARHCATEEEGVERGVEARGDGPIAACQDAPRLALGGRLPEPLLELHGMAAHNVQLGLLLLQRGRPGGAHQRLALPLPRLLQPGERHRSLASWSALSRGCRSGPCSRPRTHACVKLDAAVAAARSKEHRVAAGSPLGLPDGIAIVAGVCVAGAQAAGTGLEGASPPSPPTRFAERRIMATSRAKGFSVP